MRTDQVRVSFNNPEERQLLKDIQALAKAGHMKLSQWVRQALREKRDRDKLSN
jgi:predicted DNA-binding protein (MmcQ/YjbR family)